MDAVTDGVIISIIIVNFNVGELLTECVNSVLASSVPVEIIKEDQMLRINIWK